LNPQVNHIKWLFQLTPIFFGHLESLGEIIEVYFRGQNHYQVHILMISAKAIRQSS